jgi:hypothetical protein
MVQMNRVPVRREQVTSADGTRLAVTITGDVDRALALGLREFARMPDEAIAARPG